MLKAPSAWSVESPAISIMIVEDFIRPRLSKRFEGELLKMWPTKNPYVNNNVPDHDFEINIKFISPRDFDNRVESRFLSTWSTAESIALVHTMRSFERSAALASVFTLQIYYCRVSGEPFKFATTMSRCEAAVSECWTKSKGLKTMFRPGTPDRGRCPQCSARYANRPLRGGLDLTMTAYLLGLISGVITIVGKHHHPAGYCQPSLRDLFWYNRLFGGPNAWTNIWTILNGLLICLLESYIWAEVFKRCDNLRMWNIGRMLECHSMYIQSG